MNKKVHHNANYTYDANGERVVRYVPGRLGAFYSANQAGHNDRLESFVYPNGLLTAKTLPSMNNQHKQIATYTKHYYIGAERIASVIGTGNGVGYNICNSDFPTEAEVSALQQKVTQAGTILQDDYDFFEKHLSLSSPFVNRPGCGMSYIGKSNAFWFHPDHLGSSSYISNKNGEISQHLEYFPFGETLVEEHKNSNNSPYKFNAKELDDETGNYYYGARYYNPKFSIWLSVDPLTEKYPGWSPYNYTLLNPVKLIDPDGRSVEESAGGCPWPCPQDNTEVKKHEIKRYTERSTRELIDNIGNISIDGFMKGSQGMESRSWKRGQRVSHISYDEISGFGDKMAPSRIVRAMQSIAKGWKVLENSVKLDNKKMYPVVDDIEKLLYYDSNGNTYFYKKGLNHLVLRNWLSNDAVFYWDSVPIPVKSSKDSLFYKNQNNKEVLKYKNYIKEKYEKSNYIDH